MNDTTTDTSNQQLTDILTEVRQTRREISQVGRMVNRFRYARFASVLGVGFVGALLGAGACFGWLNRHTFPAGVSIETDSYISKSGKPIVSVTITGRGNNQASQSFSEDKTSQTVTAYFDK